MAVMNICLCENTINHSGVALQKRNGGQKKKMVKNEELS